MPDPQGKVPSWYWKPERSFQEGTRLGWEKPCLGMDLSHRDTLYLSLQDPVVSTASSRAALSTRLGYAHAESKLQLRPERRLRGFLVLFFGLLVF